jgi:hypothetical protein
LYDAVSDPGAADGTGCTGLLSELRSAASFFGHDPFEADELRPSG